MNPATLEALSCDLMYGSYTFRASGQAIRFDGFMKAYPVSVEENTLPPLKEQEKLICKTLEPTQHFTKPEPRYTEATLIKALEEHGIGRPSTYAPTIFTIQARTYVQKDEQKRFVPTEIGYMVCDLLVEHFPDIVDTGFTATMENDLDKIATNEAEWKTIVREFYEPFEKNVKKKYEKIEKKNLIEKTDKLCILCQAPAILRVGRFGKFYGCSKFPECKWTAGREPEKIGVPCFICKEGDIIVRTTKRKRVFYGCSRYPKCTFSSYRNPMRKM
jgi:DNA topoisomerase-1